MVTDHFFKPICAVAFLSLAIVAQTGSHNLSHPTPEGATVISEVSQVSQALVGKRITIHGKFSLRGKVGPYVSLDNRQTVYLESKGSFTWGKPYSDMDGKLVEASGTLKFYHEPPAKPTDRAVARLFDHFYFEAKSTRVRLIGIRTLLRSPGLLPSLFLPQT